MFHTDGDRGRPSRVRGRLTAVVAVTTLVWGCAPADAPAARDTGARFQAAVDRADAAGACALLTQQARGNLESASAEPCAQALPALDLPVGGVRSVEVWGGNAQVRLESGVLFLARFRAGWLVTGAGCQPRQDLPYDCAVQG